MALNARLGELKEHVEKMKNYYLSRKYKDTEYPKWRVEPVFKYVKDGDVVFSVGTGIGKDISFFKKAFGLDCILERLKIGNKKKNLIYGVAEFLPVKPSSIDVVIAVESLEHVYELERCLYDIYGILKDGGIFYFTVPNVVMWNTSSLPEADVRRHSCVEWLNIIWKFFEFNVELLEYDYQYGRKYCYFVFRKVG